MTNICTLPFMLLVFLGVAIVGGYRSHSEYQAKYPQKRMQSKLDTLMCGYGPISFVDGWCTQWSYRTPTINVKWEKLP